MNKTATEKPKKLKPLKERQKDALLNKGKGTKKKGSNKLVNEDGLTAQEEFFCEIYASDREFFGNGVQSYIEAFDITVVNKPRSEFPNEKTYEACKASAHLLLTNPNLLKRIDQIFEGRGLNDQFVDKKLEFIITQHAELPTMMKGIAEYNKLKKRTTTSTVEHEFGNINPEVSDADLKELIKQGEAFFQKKKLPKK